jgi:uncharacterized protein (DUF779 family)
LSLFPFLAAASLVVDVVAGAGAGFSVDVGEWAEKFVVICCCNLINFMIFFNLYA